MTIPIFVIDLVGLIAAFTALLLVIARKKTRLSRNVLISIYLLILILIFHSLSNVLEWSGIAPSIDRYEDFIQTLEPLIWGFIIYAFILNKELEVINRQKKFIEEKNILNELLIDIITHDLANYNQIVLGNIELLLDAYKKNENIENRMQKMASVVKNCRNMIRNVKMLSEIERIQENTSKAPLSSIIDSVISNVEEIYEDVTLNTTIDIKGGDKNKLVEIYSVLEVPIQNIIDNVIRFRKKENSAELAIEISQEEEIILISFLDKGIGIKDERKEEVFSRFTVGEQKDRGSGLGLAISKQIVESFGGQIWAENRPESPEDHTTGTVIKIRLNRIYGGS